MSDKSERLLKIYARLKRSPVTIEIIRDWAKKNDIKVSERTFYRDLNDLENSLILDNERLVVSEGEKNKKTWKIEYSESKNKLTKFDINSYLLFKNFMALPIVLSRQKSLDNIENLFYSTYSKSCFEDFMTVADRQIVGSHFYEVSNIISYQKILEDAIWSIQNKREMQILETDFDYTSIFSSVKFLLVFLPVQLVYHRGVIHVSGFLKGKKKLIILALEQIKIYKLSNRMFDNKPLLQLLEMKMRKRFGITENLDKKVYDIEIEFTELTGTFVKNQFWHPSQQFEKLENGNLIMKINCGINRELVGWIFQWMSNVRVVKPQMLKDLVLAKYKEIIQDIECEKPLVSNNSFRAE